MRTPARSFALAVLLLTAVVARAHIGLALQSQLGNPSAATSDPSNHTRYLIQRAQYWMDYNDTTREANWVAWNLTSSDVGSAGRSPDFFVDTTLPPGFTQVLTTAYSGSGYDRGHMCPSADRTLTRADNDITFYMSNMIPQTPDNNQGVWASFESECRNLAVMGNEVLIISGPSGFAGSTIASGVSIPGYTWKIVVVVPLGPGTALDRITSSTRVIAIKVPNIAGVRSTPWANFITSAAQIETDTGLTFFTNLPASLASVLRAKVDGQTIVGAPVIVTPPAEQTTSVGGSVTFAVSATGDAPLSYQWLKDDNEIPGGTGDTLVFSNVQATDAGSYYVIVTNAVGSITSNAAALVITGLPPAITAPPVALTVGAGNLATFSVGASGSPTLGYQWRKDTVPISGATFPTLNIPNVQATNAGNYDVVVTNSVSTATSAAALLSVTPTAPTITTHPVAQTATGGTVVTFNVAARGSEPLTCQWRKGGLNLSDGGAISGATTTTLTLTGVTNGDSGSYDVVVTNAISFATSNAALLTVNAATVVWNFGSAAPGTADPTSGLPVDITGGTVTRVNSLGSTGMLTTTSASSGYTGVSGAFNAGAAALGGGLVKGAGGSAYFELTLAPPAGKKLLITGISFGMRSTGTGPLSFAVFTSFDDYTDPVATGAINPNSAWALKTPGLTPVTGTTGTAITLRIYGYGGATNTTVNWRIDDLMLNVSTIVPSAAFAPAVASTTPASGTIGAPVSSPISITFNQPVVINGSWFTITSALNGPIAATVTGGPTTFTLTPPVSFAYGDTITTTILAGQVTEKDTGTLSLPSNHAFSFGTGLPVPPTITVQPQPKTIADGGTATFNVTASGTAPLTYAWQKNGAPIPGNASAATPALTLANVTPGDAGAYACVVSNPAGSATTDSVALTVTAVAPAVVTQPVSQLIVLGASTTLAATATGTAPLAYQWRKNGMPLADGAGVSGTTSPTLALTNATPATAGTYDVVVTNSVNSATSLPASVGVTTATVASATWNFGSVAPGTAAPASVLPADVTGGVFSAGNNNGSTTLLTTTSASNFSGASGSFNAGAAARIGVLNKASGGSAYFEFTLASAAGKQLVATGLAFGSRSTGTGPQAFSVFTSMDNYATAIATGTLANDSVWRLITPGMSGIRGAPGGSVTFRIYGYNGTGSPGAGTANWRIDDVNLMLGTETPPAVAGTSPVAAATGVPLTAPIAITFNQPVTVTGAWFAITSAAHGTVAATASGGPTTFTLTPASSWSYNDTITVKILGSRVSDLTGTLNQVGDTTFSFTTVAPTPPSIVTPPVAQTATVGATVSFSVVAAGTSPFTYQWRKAGDPITGNTSAATPTLTLTSITTADTGNYDVVVTNIAGPVTSAPATLTVNKAPATIALGALSFSYNGQPHGTTATTTPASLPVVITYNGSTTPPTNVGNYAVVATINDANYAGSAGGTLSITAASATIVLADLIQAYDGLPKPVTAVTTPPGLNVTLTYGGSATPPTNPGAYAVVAAIADPNHTGTASGTLLVTITALVRHAPSLNGGLDGSLQVISGESFTLNGNAWVSGDILVPGTPTVRLNGHPIIAGVVDGTGSVTPANYQVTLNGSAVVRYLIRRTNPIALPTVATPPAPTGTRNVVITAAGQSAGNFATLRNLTLNGNVGQFAVPAGTYGALIANGNGGFTFGVAGATTPANYQLQSLLLNGNTQLRILGPVVITLASGLSLNGAVGSSANPGWLTLNVASGGVTLNGNATLHGQVVAPTGTTIINGNSTLIGGVVADRLTINGNGELRAVEP